MRKIDHEAVQLKYKELLKKIRATVPQGKELVSNWKLDYLRIYGGYVIVEQEGLYPTAFPLGEKRRGIRDMYLALEYAIEVLEFIGNSTTP